MAKRTNSGKSTQLRRHQSALKKFALTFPEAYADNPWGETAIKVRGKVFVFMSGDQVPQGKFGMSVKLPISSEMALTLPFTEPTGYGLGRSGWVSCRFEAGDVVPEAMLKEWIDQSYRAVAPKKLSALLPPRESLAKRPAAQRPTTKRRVRA